MGLVLRRRSHVRSFGSADAASGSDTPILLRSKVMVRRKGPCDGSGEYVSLLQSWRVRRPLLRQAAMSWFLNPMSGKRRPIGWHRPTSSTRRPTSSGSARHDIIFRTLRPTTGIVSSCRPISAGHRLPRPTRYARYQAPPVSALFYPSFGSLNLQAVRFSFAPYAMRDCAYG